MRCTGPNPFTDVAKENKISTRREFSAIGALTVSRPGKKKSEKRPLALATKLWRLSLEHFDESRNQAVGG